MSQILPIKITLGSDPVDMNRQRMYSVSPLNKRYCRKPMESKL